MRVINQTLLSTWGINHRWHPVRTMLTGWANTHASGMPTHHAPTTNEMAMTLGRLCACSVPIDTKKTEMRRYEPASWPARAQHTENPTSAGTHGHAESAVPQLSQSHEPRQQGTPLELPHTRRTRSIRLSESRSTSGSLVNSLGMRLRHVTNTMDTTVAMPVIKHRPITPTRLAFAMLPSPRWYPIRMLATHDHSNTRACDQEQSGNLLGQSHPRTYVVASIAPMLIELMNMNMVSMALWAEISASPSFAAISAMPYSRKKPQQGQSAVLDSASTFQKKLSIHPHITQPEFGTPPTQ